MKRIPILMFAFTELDAHVRAAIIEEARDKSLSKDWARPVIDRFYDTLGKFTDGPQEIEVSFEPFGKNVHFGLGLQDLMKYIDAPAMYDEYLAPMLKGFAKYFTWDIKMNPTQDYKFVGYFFINNPDLPVWRTSPSWAMNATLRQVSNPPPMGKEARAAFDVECTKAFENMWRDMMDMCKATYKELMEEYEFLLSDQVIIDRLHELDSIVYTKDGIGIVLQGNEHTAYAEENKERKQYVVLNTEDESNPRLVLNEHKETRIFKGHEEAEKFASTMAESKIIPYSDNTGE